MSCVERCGDERLGTRETQLAEEVGWPMAAMPTIVRARAKRIAAQENECP